MNTFKKLIPFFSILFFGTFSYADKTHQKTACEIQNTVLTIYKKEDFKIISETCQDTNPYIANYLNYDDKKIFINKYSLDVGKWIPELAAVSVYKKSGKPPLLITIHTQDWDTPTISGVSYDINLYKIINDKGNISLVDISKKLGDNQSGLDGESDQKMVFKLKNISLIKKWLDKNYK